jgi:hypothetical protein
MINKRHTLIRENLARIVLVDSRGIPSELLDELYRLHVLVGLREYCRCGDIYWVLVERGDGGRDDDALDGRSREQMSTRKVVGGIDPRLPIGDCAF